MSLTRGVLDVCGIGFFLCVYQFKEALGGSLMAVGRLFMKVSYQTRDTIAERALCRAADRRPPTAAWTTKLSPPLSLSSAASEVMLTKHVRSWEMSILNLTLSTLAPQMCRGTDSSSLVS